MSGFLDRAKAAAQQTAAAGKQRVEDAAVRRNGQDLVRKLGIAYYDEQRGSGSAEAARAALEALDEHVRQHGRAGLD